MVLWELFEIFITLFECSISMHFVCKFLGLDFTDKSNYKFWYGLVLCYAIAVTIINFIIPYEGMLVFIYSLIVFLYATFFLPGTIIKKIVASVLFLCVIIMNSSLGVNLTSALLNSNATEIYTESNFTRFITVTFVQALNLLAFQVLEKTTGGGALNLRFGEWMLLLSSFFVSILGMTLIQIAATNLEVTDVLRLCFLGVDFSIIIIDYITIQLISVLSHHHQTELENQQMRLQLQYQLQYAETVRQQEASVRRLRHDFKATISALYDFLHNNQLPAMKSYLDAYAISLLETASIVNTNQPFLNAILNAKLTYAKERGIVCTCYSPTNLPSINGMDYCSLLGNLLDNAIEYSLLVSEREIAVKIDFIDSKLIVVVRNRIQNNILYSNPELHTTKGDNFNHGFGIPTIKEIVKKYNGEIDFYDMDGWFNARVVIYT